MTFGSESNIAPHLLAQDFIAVSPMSYHPPIHLCSRLSDTSSSTRGTASRQALVQSENDRRPCPWKDVRAKETEDSEDLTFPVLSLQELWNALDAGILGQDLGGCGEFADPTGCRGGVENVQTCPDMQA